MGKSTWVATVASVPEYPALKEDIRTEVVIVGGGLTGITTAYLLAKAGKKVVLIDKGTAAESVSAYTTAFLNYELDTSLVDLEKMFGTTAAQRLWRALAASIDSVERTAAEEDIQCEFVRCPLITFARTEEEWKDVQEEAAKASELGFSAEARRDAQLPFSNAGYMVTQQQAKFHALKYAIALKERARAYGAKIFDRTEALEVAGNGEERIVKCANAVIFAQDVVQATYYPFTKPKQLFAHTGGYVTYIIEYAVAHGILPEAMYQDNNNPYHYFRVDLVSEHEDRLIVGGEDHREEIRMNEDRNYNALHEFLSGLLPGIRLTEVRRWSGPIIEPLDGLPFIGTIAGDQHQFVATGYAGVGMTFSRLAAEIISDTIQGNGNEYADLFKPARIPTPYQLAKKGKDYIGELAGGAGKNIFRNPRPRP